jgi:rare lipoprotein A
MSYRQFGFAVITAALLTAAAPAARAQSYLCEEQVALSEQDMACYRFGPEAPPPAQPAPAPRPDPLYLRVLKYAQVALKHRVQGLASYYSTSLDGTLTANGERFRNAKFTAAHLTLPLGTWVEVTSRATGRKIRVRINDRGPYVKKFCLDLSQAAARALGVDRAEDRHVDIRIIALPGEEPLPEGTDLPAIAPEIASASASTTLR